MVESFSAEPPRLRVLEAVREGWKAFSRAPWVFVGFTLLLTAVNGVCSSLQNLGINDKGEITHPSLLVLSLVGSLAGVVVSLWGSVAMVRGSWNALEGGTPSFSTFVRWDGAALWRLLRNGLVLGLVVVAMGVVAALLAVGAFQLSQVLVAVPVLALMVVIVYLAVTQKFLTQVSLLEGSGPIEAIQRGRRVVDPQWWEVFLLALVEAGVLLLGLLACFLGVFVAIPVVSCIGTAAYRQIFGTEDRTGLMAGGEGDTGGTSLV
ncbi:MAG: hypothetical protein ACOVNL_12470 [Prochlorococcaceae cyanobacterium]|jgi:uncharacterized membrane protein